MINPPDFAELFFDIIICRHNLPDWLLPIETLSNVFICYHGILDSVIISSGALYPLKTCHCIAIFQILDAAILPRSICKSAAVLKDQIAVSRAYFWACS